MLDRFYLPAELRTGAVELQDEEFHHLAHVLRKRTGDRVTLFDGAGGAAEARVVSIGKRAAGLCIDELRPAEAGAHVRISIASAVPKGDRAKWMIEKLTEVGVDAWRPLQTARSITDPGTGKREKLQQTVVAACKQCGRNRLMTLEAPTAWGAWLHGAANHDAVFVADRTGVPIKDALERFTLNGTPPTQVCAGIGPEGGLSDDELVAAGESGASVVSLGSFIQRIETAAVSMAAVLRAVLR